MLMSKNVNNDVSKDSPIGENNIDAPSFLQLTYRHVRKSPKDSNSCCMRRDWNLINLIKALQDNSWPSHLPLHELTINA